MVFLKKESVLNKPQKLYAAYAQDGVNLDLGDSFSAFAAQVCRSTWKSSRFVKVKDFAATNFRGPRGFRLHNLPKGFYCDTPSDGVGTKVGILTEAFAHRCAGRDLFAMTASDITRWGGLPLVMSNVLDVSTLGEPGSSTYEDMAELLVGLGEACREQGVVLMRGETAELGPFVGSENPDARTKFNWSGFMVGAYHPRRVLDGSRMRNNDCVMALREKGLRSNGFSSVRKALAAKFGTKWWSKEEAHSTISRAAEPSVLYDRFLAQLNGWYSPDFKPLIRIKAIVHISGGGIPGKFAEDLLFPRGLSASLMSLWDPPQVMKDCLEWHPSMTEEEAYRVWNGGQGMLVVIDTKDVDQFYRLARQDGVEARLAGRIDSAPKQPQLEILSKFTEGWLYYHPKE